VTPAKPVTRAIPEMVPLTDPPEPPPGRPALRRFSGQTTPE